MIFEYTKTSIYNYTTIFGWFNHVKPGGLLVKSGILNGEADQADQSHATQPLISFFGG